MSKKALVLGASGFLGSHITKELVKQGREVRIFLRESSDTRATDHLDIERCYGDVMNRASLDAAMNGCASVFYCVVDTRAWLRDPEPLYRVNVDGLYNAMDAALEAGIERFIFTSSFVTVGLKSDGASTEDDAFNWWDTAPEYIRCRVTAEKRLMEYCEDKALPGIACLIGNTYGDGDYAPTPHGKLILDASISKMPFYWTGGGPTVGIRDAALAMILAEQKGRIGERYLIAERWMTYKELFSLAAIAGGRKPPPLHIPSFLMYSLSVINGMVTAIRGTENRMSIDALKCASKLNDVDCNKARRELDWQPRPVEESIKEAIAFYRDFHKANKNKHSS